LEIVQRHPDWSNQVLELLKPWLSSDIARQQRSQVATGLLASFLTNKAFQERIGKTLNDPATTATTQHWLMSTIATGRSLPLVESWVKPIETLLASDNSESLALGISIAQALKTDRFNQQLTKVASRPATSAILRVAALGAVSGNSGQLTGKAFDTLTQLIAQPTTDTTETASLGKISATDSARAAQMLGSASLTKEQLIELAPLLEQAGPLELRDLVRPFQRNSNLETRSAFLASLEQSRSFLSLPHQVFSDIVKGYPDELRPRANRMLDQLKKKDQQQSQQLDELLPLLKTGNVGRGKTVFENQKTKCASCHQVHGKGGKIGPDLSNIGANRQGRDLLESIVLPSASLVRQYEAFSIVTTEGRVFTGLIARETEDAIYVQQQTGDPVMVPRNEIDELVPSTVSIMPNDLDKALSRQDLADLIAYLKTLKKAR